MMSFITLSDHKKEREGLHMVGKAAARDTIY
ncbi:hypothetical protein BN1200_2040004 [Klebsiella variicola]|nr:hypothetical protein BN1200_2040004 [Klebsiella variicola]